MTWKNITLEQYLQLYDVVNGEMDLDEKEIQIANIIYGFDITELPIGEYKDKLKELKFVNTMPEKEKLASSYNINGVKYITKAELGSMQANQFIDFQNYMKNQDMIGCISCFFIPDGHKYNDGYDMLKVKKDIGQLPITSANALTFFFKSQYAVLLVLSQRYSLKLMKEMGMSRKKIKEMQNSLATLGTANLAAILSY